ncbi:MAG: hypothetical protein U5R31_15785 [Acidimicrobiia bacterium]|nr:hypothetical protein [Acidimicrobiia bacterium]
MDAERLDDLVESTQLVVPEPGRAVGTVHGHVHRNDRRHHQRLGLVVRRGEAHEVGHQPVDGLAVGVDEVEPERIDPVVASRRMYVPGSRITTEL